MLIEELSNPATGRRTTYVENLAENILRETENEIDIGILSVHLFTFKINL